MRYKYLTERQMNANFLLKDGDYRSIREMLERLNRMIPNYKILAELNEKKEIVYHTAHDMYEEVMNLGDGLIAEGLQGAHIAIVAENSVKYVISDICISSGVGVVTPIDFNAPQELLETLLNKCDADAVLCCECVLDSLKKAQESCPRLKTIITVDKKVDGILFYDDVVAKGASLKDKSIYRNIELDLYAPAKILFTSGTTGANKGVILSNANLIANAINCMDSINAMEGEENTSMSVLPMHHATEINTHIMTRIAGGRLTYINGNMRNMMTNIKIFKPTIMTIVPMIANAFYKTIWANAKKMGKDEKLKKGIKISNLLRKFGVDKTHKMFADIYENFGGNLDMIVCGGSMLNPVTIKGLNDIGIRLENGYGITECGPLISMNANTLKEHLSVGKPCPGLQAKIINPDDDGIGELCIKGASVSKGYYKDEAATAAVFGEDGFFNTGDAAKISSDGRIFLMGRKKNTIILANGKNVCPEEVENVIETNIDFIDEVVVYQADFKQGNVSEPIICAGIFIKDEAKRADRNAIATAMRKVNEVLPDYKRIEYVELPDKEYEKTSTRKIKRATLPAECSGKGIIVS